MRFLTLLWTLAASCLCVVAEPIDTLITASDLLKINQPSHPVLSPDGKRVAYVVRFIESPAGGEPVYRSRLWVASIDGDSAPRELTSAGDSVFEPCWHPAGDRIAFVRAEAGDRSRVWVQSASGGTPVALTPALRGLSSPRWSPDGNRLLFTANVTFDEARAQLEKNKAANLSPRWSDEKPSPPSPAPAAATTPTASSNTAQTPPAPATAAKTAATKTSPSPPAPTPSPDGTLAARRAWLAQNSARREPLVTNRPDLSSAVTQGEPEFMHLFVIDRPGSEPLNLTPGYVSVKSPEWLRDGQSIVCASHSENVHPDRAQRQQLVLVKTDGTGLTPLADSPEYSLDQPVVSPDGKQIAFTAQPAKNGAELAFGQTRIATLDLPNGALKILTAKFDRSAGRPAWSTDGKSIFFTAETGGSVPIHRATVPGGNVTRIISTDTWITGFAVGADDLVMVSSRPANPGELYRTRLTGSSSRILTAHNSEWLRDKKPAAPERKKIKQPDGTEIDYWIARPPYIEGGFHYPLLVMVHGGPASMWGSGAPAVWHDMQFFAARGYVVVYANPRGSTGYGEKFQHAVFQNWAPGPAGDVLAVAQAAAKDSWVDEDRQLILGGSYGGYLTAWILSIDQRFKAAVVARGVYDLTSFFGEGGSWRLIPWQFGGYPWQPEIRKLLDAQSPITRADSIRTPLLIKQNDADLQAGPDQGGLLYRSLKQLGRPVEFVSYPRASHAMSRTGAPSQRIDRLVRFDEFFQRFVGTPAQPVPLPPVTPEPPAAPAPPATPKPAQTPVATQAPNPAAPDIPTNSPKPSESPKEKATPAAPAMDSMMMDK